MKFFIYLIGFIFFAVATVSSDTVFGNTVSPFLTGIFSVLLIKHLFAVIIRSDLWAIGSFGPFGGDGGCS